MANESSPNKGRKSTSAESVSSLGSATLDLTALRETLSTASLPNVDSVTPIEPGPVIAISAPTQQTANPGRGSGLPVPAGEAETQRPRVSFASNLVPDRDVQARGSAMHHKSVVSLVSERDAVVPALLPQRGSIASDVAGQTFDLESEHASRRSTDKRRSTQRSLLDGSWVDVQTVSSCTSEDTPDVHRRRLLSLAVSDGGLMDATGEVDLAKYASQRPVHTLSVEDPPRPPLWLKYSEVGANHPEDNSVKGRYFDRSVWAYYTHSGRWSDGMGAPVQDGCGALFCCCPPLWPIRLFMTLRRAIPLDLRLACCRCHLRPEAAIRSAGALAFLAASMVLVPVGLIVYLLYSNVQTKSKANEAIPWREVLSSSAPGIAILAIPFALGVVCWAAIFHAVGWKYNIRDPQNRPISFLLKVCCCLPAMNVRIGLHVDRAQGFCKPNKYVRQMIRMSECVRVVTPQARVELSPIPHSISGDVLADDNLRQVVEGCAEVEQHARRLSQGRPSRTPFLFT